MYDFEKDEELHVLTMPGDYIRMTKWADEHLAGTTEGETVTSLRRNYATAWHALKRRGKLAEHGMPSRIFILTSFSTRISSSGVSAEKWVKSKRTSSSLTS